MSVYILSVECIKDIEIPKCHNTDEPSRHHPKRLHYPMCIKHPEYSDSVTDSWKGLEGNCYCSMSRVLVFAR